MTTLPSDDNHPAATPGGEIDPQRLPSALVGEAVALLVSLLGGAKDGKELLDAFRAGSDPSRPLRCAVLACRQETEHIRIELRIRNGGEHGVYLTRIETEETLKSAVLDVNDAPAKRGQIGFQDASDVSHPLLDEPLLIAPGSAQFLAVNIAPLDERRLRSAPHGALTIRYVVAGVARSNLSETVEFAFA